MEKEQEKKDQTDAIEAPKESKKPYAMPSLTVHGTVENLTSGSGGGGCGCGSGSILVN